MPTIHSAKLNQSVEIITATLHSPHLVVIDIHIHSIRQGALSFMLTGIMSLEVRVLGSWELGSWEVGELVSWELGVGKSAVGQLGSQQLGSQMIGRLGIREWRNGGVGQFRIS